MKSDAYEIQEEMEMIHGQAYREILKCKEPDCGKPLYGKPVPGGIKWDCLEPNCVYSEFEAANK